MVSEFLFLSPLLSRNVFPHETPCAHSSHEPGPSKAGQHTPMELNTSVSRRVTVVWYGSCTWGAPEAEEPAHDDGIKYIKYIGTSKKVRVIVWVPGVRRKRRNQSQTRASACGRKRNHRRIPCYHGLTTPPCPPLSPTNPPQHPFPRQHRLRSYSFRESQEHCNPCRLVVPTELQRLAGVEQGVKASCQTVLYCTVLCCPLL